MKKLIVFFLLTAVFTLTGCITRVSVGPTLTDSQTVEAGDIDAAQVNIQMGIGELDIASGSGNLMDAEFSYNIEDWRPEVQFEQRGSRGELTVSQPDGEINGIPDDDIVYRWEVAFANDIPMDMNVDLGVGESNLELGELYLQDLVVDTGVGKTTIDLTGNIRESYDVKINGGVGETTVYLPEDVGLRVEANTGIGSLVINGLQKDGDSNVYTNDLYGTTDVDITLEISGGIGEITIQVGR